MVDCWTRGSSAVEKLGSRRREVSKSGREEKALGIVVGVFTVVDDDDQRGAIVLYVTCTTTSCTAPVLISAGLRLLRQVLLELWWSIAPSPHASGHRSKTVRVGGSLIFCTTDDSDYILH